MARRVETGCRDCTRCTNSAVGNAGRAVARGTANMATFGMASAFTRKCKTCGHVMSLHGQDTTSAAPAERRDEPHQTARDHVDAYLRGEYPKWKLTGRELLLLRKANQEAGAVSTPADSLSVPAGYPPAPTSSVADELKKLAELRDAGVLSAAEFDAAKARLLI